MTGLRWITISSEDDDAVAGTHPLVIRRPALLVRHAADNRDGAAHGQSGNDSARRCRDDPVRYGTAVVHLLVVGAVGTHVIRAADDDRRGSGRGSGEDGADGDARCPATGDARRDLPALVRLVALAGHDPAVSSDADESFFADGDGTAAPDGDGAFFADHHAATTRRRPG